MAADNSEVIMALMAALGVGGGNNRNRPWQSYGGINNTGPSTLIQQARGQVTNITRALLGPTFGPLVGSIAADYIVGQDFTRSGGLHNSLSGLLSPSAGTYANAFQRTRQNQTLRMLTSNREEIQKSLRKDFYTNYYDLTMQGNYASPEARKNAVNAQVESAMNNLVSVPAALQFFMDPAQNRRAMQGIKDTQAGALYWQSRMQPDVAMGLTIPDSRTGIQPQELAKQVGTTIQNMVKGANAWNLGKGTGGIQQSYGGFNGASVAELASILQNASDQLDISGMQGLQKSLKEFSQKVRETSRALAPLKDIFGQDIKAMTDMIQTTTGQNISQLSPSMISSIAKNTSDMARYSGATIAQIANAGQKLFMQSSQMGGTTFSRIGATQTGAFYSGLIAQGNAPAGVHAAEYAGNTQRALASAQASAGADRAAMAYGLWKESREAAGQDASVQRFMTQVQGNRGSTDSMMQALVNTVNKGRSADQQITQHGLIKGVLTGGYREALQSGRMAELGITQQYQNKLATSILGLRMSGMKQVSDQSLKQLGAFMSDQKNATAVKDLLTNANTPGTAARFMQRAKDAGYSAITEKAIQFVLNRGQLTQQGTRWAAAAQMRNFAASQQQLRKDLAPLEAQGTGAYLSFWRALSNAPEGGLTSILKDPKSAGLTIKQGGKTATISRNAILLHTRALLGTVKDEDTEAALKTIRDTFGKERADQILALASGELAKDQKYIKSLRRVAEGIGSKPEDKKSYDNARAYILARRNKHISSTVSQQSFAKDSQARALYTEASSVYLKQMEAARNQKTDTARQAAQKRAGDTYYKSIQNAYRMRNVQKATYADLGKDLGLKTEGDFNKLQPQLKNLIRSGQLSRYAQLSKEEFEKLRKTDKNISGLSQEQVRTLQRVTSTGYDRNKDFMREVTTIMTAIKNFLEGLTRDGVKVHL